MGAGSDRISVGTRRRGDRSVLRSDAARIDCPYARTPASLTRAVQGQLGPVSTARARPWPRAGFEQRSAGLRGARSRRMAAHHAAQRTPLEGAGGIVLGCGWGFGRLKAELTDNRVLHTVVPDRHAACTRRLPGAGACARRPHSAAASGAPGTTASSALRRRALHGVASRPAVGQDTLM
jgi:hypothetical protein